MHAIVYLVTLRGERCKFVKSLVDVKNYGGRVLHPSVEVRCQLLRRGRLVHTMGQSNL